MLWIQYADEHLVAGALGRGAVVLAFVSALLAAIAGVYATRARFTPGSVTEAGWPRLVIGAYGVMSVCIVTVIALLLTMMTQQWYEYQYVQQHVNDELPFRYVFTAFWEGQEGSFLLWLFWHSILGLVVWATDRTWRLPVLTVMAAVQVVLLSMLLGVYLPLGEAARVGSSPFNLLREVMDAPIFAQSDYVSLIEGTGLNPLLQNYWMIIHPPTLFLGFASVLVPFAYAISGLWTRQHTAWLQPALRWALFSAGILGIGILMGGAWAYEALNFGGYWAWDPVENTSLVPWLLLLAGIHTNLVARATGHSIRSTYVFYLLGFVGIAYSSFLTRSGVLGETSVHAFTEMGLEVQLMLLVGLFAALGAAALAYRWRGIPTKAQEESIASREFWIFLGSLVVLFSAAMITASTSLPVVNKLADAIGWEIQHLTINEPVAHYNKYQLWVGVFMGIFTGAAQLLRWRGSSVGGSRRRKLLIRAAVSAAVSLALAAVTHAALHVQGVHFFALAFASYFALLSSLDYLVTSRVGLWQRLGSYTAHTGFAVMLIGVLFSGLNKEHISKNTFAMEGLLGEEQIGKNVLLVKGGPMVINGYEVTYLSDTLVGNRRDYAIRYRELDGEDGTIGKEFVLHPYSLYTNDFEKIASTNPDTKHYWDHDVFTHITGLPPGAQSAEQAKTFEDSLRYERYALGLGGEAVSTGKHRLTAVDVLTSPTHPDYEPEPGDVALGLRVRIDRLDFDTTEYAEPVVVLRENLVYSYPAQVNAFSVRVQLPEDVFGSYYGDEGALLYEEYELAPGQSVDIGSRRLTFEQFDREVDHPGYVAEAGDVAVAARLSVRADAGEAHSLAPVYFIRGDRPGQVKDVSPELGLHARLVGLDPATGRATVAVAQRGAGGDDAVAAALLPVEVAENASRNDWVVLEATVFPGINLFWIGSVAMLLGLLISMGFRIREKHLRNVEAHGSTPRRQVPQPTRAAEPVA